MRTEQTEQIDRSRRFFLRCGNAVPVPAYRPPWTDETAVVTSCTRCGSCAEACREKIITFADGGYPTIDFAAGSGHCTFCGDCVVACPEDVFDTGCQPAWDLKVILDSQRCLAEAGVHCECCRDICDTSAIRFRPRLGAPPAPVLTLEDCTGCGACIAVCPKGALSVSPGQPGEAAA